MNPRTLKVEATMAIVVPTCAVLFTGQFRRGLAIAGVSPSHCGRC